MLSLHQIRYVVSRRRSSFLQRGWQYYFRSQGPREHGLKVGGKFSIGAGHRASDLVIRGKMWEKP